MRLESEVAANSVDASPTPESTSSNASSEGVGLTAEEEESHFKWLRETASASVLHEEMVELSKTLSALVAPEVQRRIRDKEYQSIQADDDGAFYLRKVADRNLVEFYTTNDAGQPVKVVLPEGKFPDAYRIKAQMNWLEDLTSNAQK